MSPQPHPFRLILAAAAIVAGVGLGAAGVASAASPGTTTTTPATPMSDAPPTDPATLSHGPGETLLTGTELTGAVSAATAAEPGATVVRAETDSAGSPYEVHMRTASGAYVTVKLDGAFTVTAVEEGPGAGPAGATPPAGARPSPTA
jgi:hypothetical protein